MIAALVSEVRRLIGPLASEAFTDRDIASSLAERLSGETFAEHDVSEFAEPSGSHWVTLKSGLHVYLSGDGLILKGPKHMQHVNVRDLGSRGEIAQHHGTSRPKGGATDRKEQKGEPKVETIPHSGHTQKTLTPHLPEQTEAIKGTETQRKLGEVDKMLAGAKQRAAEAKGQPHERQLQQSVSDLEALRKLMQDESGVPGGTVESQPTVEGSTVKPQTPQIAPEAAPSPEVAKPTQPPAATPQTAPASNPAERPPELPGGRQWTKQMGQEVVDHLSASSGAKLRMVGSVAMKGVSEHDIDVMADGPFDKPKMDAALEKMGFEYQGQSLLSPKEAAAAKKPFSKDAWSELHHYKQPGTGRQFELWSVLPKEQSQAATTSTQPVEQAAREHPHDSGHLDARDADRGEMGSFTPTPEESAKIKAEGDAARAKYQAKDREANAAQATKGKRQSEPFKPKRQPIALKPGESLIGSAPRGRPGGGENSNEETSPAGQAAAARLKSAAPQHGQAASPEGKSIGNSPIANKPASSNSPTSQAVPQGQSASPNVSSGNVSTTNKQGDANSPTPPTKLPQYTASGKTTQNVPTQHGTPAPWHETEPAQLRGSDKQIRYATAIRHKRLGEALSLAHRAVVDLTAKGDTKNAEAVGRAYQRLAGRAEAGDWVRDREINGGDMLRRTWKEAQNFSERHTPFPEPARKNW